MRSVMFGALECYCLYFCVVSLLFGGKPIRRFLSKIDKGTPDKRSEEWEGISKEGEQLVELMMRTDPNKRNFSTRCN